MDSDDTQTLDNGGPTGRRIGNYRILEKIGEGGMGEVWLAEQTEPVRRRVALKLIRTGMDTKRVVARFEAERQALALMDHPAIAKIHDGGVTPDGRPFFVMEYVKGTPIHVYCDRKRMTTDERLVLFARVCEGVQHAHRKAIIHRDLKPSNVLVTEIEGEPHPKIIDFGVAKALVQPLTERTLHTEVGMLIGTIEYMSPEQADLESQDIDTRTDVYSLGVILYQLLVGALPFDSRELRSAGLEAMVRRIREEDPIRPSARLNTLETSRESAERRQVLPKTLKRQLSGDLDWITMKALEKDPARRYESPLNLAEDISAHLACRPIKARAPSWRYRTHKFLRRHRLGVRVAGMAIVVALAFVAYSAIQTGRIEVERQRARLEAESADKLLGHDPAVREDGVIGFSMDLDEIAPLGDGSKNAAVWFADFVRRNGDRHQEWLSARGRKKRTSTLLAPDAPLLLEAEHWVDQATMRFYPDVWEPRGVDTQLPNALMALDLIRSWIARGDATEDLEVAMEDYRRAIRLGRLLRQEDAVLITDFIGLGGIRQGFDAMERRLRAEGDDRQADKIALARCDLTSQRFQSSQLFNSISVSPYTRFSWWRGRVEVPEWKLDVIERVARHNPNRRMRHEAAGSLCLISLYGWRDHKKRAQSVLEELGRSDDVFLASSARCYESQYR